MRGTLITTIRAFDIPRIIPADAGNTAGSPTTACSTSDHPRGCGEHSRYALARIVELGSSPRMRGTRTASLIDCAGLGIIPADAGNTLFCLESRQPGQDHPRGCGEHVSVGLQPRQWTGSSPRMRGTLSRSASLLPRPGIIPADAGNTPLSFLCSVSKLDHPRGCGEHMWPLIE